MPAGPLSLLELTRLACDGSLARAQCDTKSEYQGYICVLQRVMSWSITEEKRKEKSSFENSFVPAGDSQKEKRVFWKVYAWLAPSVKVATLF